MQQTNVRCCPLVSLVWGHKPTETLRSQSSSLLEGGCSLRDASEPRNTLFSGGDLSVYSWGMRICLSSEFLSILFFIRCSKCFVCVCVWERETVFLLNLCSCWCPGLWLKNDSFSNLVTLLKKKNKHPNFLFCFQSLKNYPSNSWILSLCKWVKWYRVNPEVFLQPSKG